MKKYLLTFEIRPRSPFSYDDKTVALGMYDTYENACDMGNKLLELMESRFPLHVFPNGNTKKERFGYYNFEQYKQKHNIVSNSGYLETPFTFYAKIATVDFVEFDEINGIIDTTLDKQADKK
jgi:hypothetical protein